MSSREEILALSNLQTESVFIKPWDRTVTVRAMSGTERDQFEAANLTKDRKGNYEVNLKNIRARLVVLSVVNEDGSRMFKDEDVAGVGALSAAALETISDVARRLSGITPADVEELAKN